MSGILRHRRLWLTLLATLFLGVLAYQFTPTYFIPVGSWYDRVALRDGWWSDEVADGQRYRWTSGHVEIELANFGKMVSASYIIALDLQPSAQVVASYPPTITLDTRRIIPEPYKEGDSSYYYHVASAEMMAAGSSPHLAIDVPTFNAAGDSRNLGVKVVGFRVYEDPRDDFSLIIPPLLPLLYLLLIALCAYLCLAGSRAIGIAASIIGVGGSVYSVLINRPLGVWGLPATLLVVALLLVWTWRRPLFGWLPPLVTWLRDLPETSQRIRFSGEAENAADGEPSESLSQRIRFSGEAENAADGEPSESLSQRERFGEGEASHTSTPEATQAAAPISLSQRERFGEGESRHTSRPEAADNPPNSNLKPQTSNLALLLFVAIILYAAFALWLVLQVDFIGHADYADNAVVARNLAHGLGATTDYVAQFYTAYPRVQHPADTWPLLQPLLIAPFIWLLGDSTWVAKLPNLLLALALASSVFYIGKRLWDARVGLLAALLTLAYPYLLYMVVYPANDLVFALLSLWLVYIVVRWRLGVGGWWVWAGFGALAGLLVWAKPSGAILVLALFGYALGRAWLARGQGGAGRRMWLTAMTAAGVGLAVISPLLVRNIGTFGAPFYSTESYDAWVLKWYPPYERIYGYWSPRDLPNRSWLLRYGFDNIYKYEGREISALAVGNSPAGGGDGLLGGDIGSPLAVGLAILALVVAPRGWRLGQRIIFNGAGDASQRIRFSGEADTADGEPSESLSPRERFGEGEARPTPTPQATEPPIPISLSPRERLGEGGVPPASVAAPLLISLLLYAGFIVGYWHYEARYFQAYAVWVFLLAAAAIFWLYDVLARRAVVVGAVVALGLAAALLVPALIQIAADTPNYAGATPMVEAGQWLEQHTAPASVVMSRNPWEFSWHSHRLGVMIPNDPKDLNRSLPQIKAAAQQYGATYLMLDHLGSPGATYFRTDWRRDIAPMYNPRTACRGFSKVYENKNVIIYRMDVVAIGDSCNTLSRKCKISGMKICMVTSSYPKYRGDVTAPFIEGIATSVANLGAGNEVHILAPYHPDLRHARIEQGVHLHFFKYAPIRNLNIWGYAESLEADIKLKAAIYPLTPIVLFSSAWSLLRLTSRIKFDVMHAHWVIPNGPVAAMVARVRHLPLVISLHGSDVWVAERNSLLRRVARSTFRRADGVSASSDDLRQRAIRIGAPRRASEVIPYGVDPASFAPAATPDPGAELRHTLDIPAADLIIFSVGRMVYKKGFEYLIRALPAVLAAHPHARLVLAGGGDLLDELKRLAQSLGVSERVSFPGWVERDKLPLYFSGCDLFVLPSVRDEAGNIDGLPNTLLEAMASGRPVVASRVAGVPLAVRPGENGELVAEKDPAALAEAINLLLADPGLRARYGEASRRRVLDDLNWQAVAGRFMDLYALARRHYLARHR